MRRLNVFMPAPGEGWVGDVQTAEFHANTRHNIVHDIHQADVIWLFSKWIADRFPIEVLRAKPCITTVHHIVPAKGLNLPMFELFTDVYHVPNQYTERSLEKGTRRPIIRLPYWTPTTSRFVPDQTLDDVLGRFRDVSGGFLFASFQRDTEGASIASPKPSPKLEKGPDILVEVLRRFDADASALLLGGWRRQYVESNIKHRRGDPDRTLISLFDPDSTADAPALQRPSDINLFYNVLRRKGGIYLVTSRHEGGPMAVLEAAATQTRILSTTMGIAPEVLHPDCLCGEPDGVMTLDAFERKIRGDIDWDVVVEHNFKRAQELSIQNVIVDYDDLIERLYESKQ